MIDYSIELAHVYADESIRDEQIRSLVEGARIIKELSTSSKSFSEDFRFFGGFVKILTKINEWRRLYRLLFLLGLLLQLFHRLTYLSMPCQEEIHGRFFWP